MKELLVSTTSTLDGYKINKYLGVINANIVIGTNYFSDVAASLTDIFGGNSGSYQRKMDLMYKEATKELTLKAQKSGGNAIVGFSVDFDEISGKGKSMFMLSASGTVCVVERLDKQTENIQYSGLISSDLISQEMKQQKLREIISSGSAVFSEDEWSFMRENPSLETIKLLVEKCYFKLHGNEERANVEILVSQINYDEACEMVYPLYTTPLSREERALNYGDNDDYVRGRYALLIRNCMLFNPKMVADLLKKDLKKAVNLLDCDKPLYSTEDLSYMEEICQYLDSLPDKGKIEVGKDGMFSKEKELFICGNGHKNEKNIVFCTTCGENIKGLDSKQVEKIEAFKNKVKVLSEFFSKEK